MNYFSLRQFVFIIALAVLLTTLPLQSIFKKMRQKDMKEANDRAKMQNTEEPEVGINADENISGISHLNEPLANEPELETLRNELGEMKDKFIRKVAEFENFKKRSLKERMELIQTAGKEVIIDMLEVLDDCERAEKQMSSLDDMAKEGVMLVFNKLKSLLTAKGLKPMETINQDFNPDIHEAITEIPAPTPELKGKVIDEIQKGYYLNDKIIRYAKVVVGK
ncbi:MAG TPA: nucleotide exchange factor GrpE [Chitinophagaceae bacterium]|nr:nucleotide exchange factor GrpE [Chitinophagaceae bacterium]